MLLEDTPIIVVPSYLIGLKDQCVMILNGKSIERIIKSFGED